MLDSHNMAGSRLRSERTAPRTDNHSAARIANRDIGPEIDESADLSSSPTRLAPLLATSACLPSGVIATAAGSAGGGEGTVAVGLVATDTVPTGFTSLPSIDIDGQKVSNAQVNGKNYDMASGLNPLNVQITPDGKLAIVNNIGGGQDGGVDTVGIIDLEASPPRVIDQVVVGDGPEGLAMSPAGGYAASLILNGTGGTPKTAFYRHEHSYVALLKIDGKTVRKVGQTDVGGLAEGLAFSPDGHFPLCWQFR